MGFTCSTCKSCNSCTDQVYDFILSDSHLEKFQNQKIKLSQLNRYDQFYRMIGFPFIEMEIEDYFAMLETIVSKYKDFLQKNKESGNME